MRLHLLHYVARMKAEHIPSESDKLRAIDLLYNRFNQAFAYYFWDGRIRPMLASHPDFHDEQFEIVTVENACLASVLMDIRSLDDFFLRENRDGKMRQPRSDDVHVTDFPNYKSTARILSDTERDSINQWVAHQTYHPVWTGKTGIAPNDSQHWNTVELIEKAGLAMFGFMDFLDCEYSQTYPDEAARSQKMKGFFQRRLKMMKALPASS